MPRITGSTRDEPYPAINRDRPRSIDRSIGRVARPLSPLMTPRILSKKTYLPARRFATNERQTVAERHAAKCVSLFPTRSACPVADAVANSPWSRQGRTSSPWNNVRDTLLITPSAIVLFCFNSNDCRIDIQSCIL